MFATCCLVTELRPLRWLRRDEGGQVTASWTFMVAMLLVAPPVATIAIAAGIVLVGDLVSRKPPLKVVFNAAQMCLCLTLGAAVLVATGQDEVLRLGAAPPWPGSPLSWPPGPSCSPSTRP